MSNFLGDLWQYKTYKARRESSYDRSGRNDDAVPIEAGETKVLADIEGPGVITHIWFTIACEDEQYLRKLVLRVFWDDEKNPSVLAPVGDFFGIGHAYRATYQCALFSVSAQEQSRGQGMAMNCWIPMPFNKRARFEIVNECEETKVNAFYYYIDYQAHPAALGDVPYFHANWRRELPTDGWTGRGSTAFTHEYWERWNGPDGVNLSDEGNYRILHAKGRGHFLGCNVSIRNLSKHWWGEGDDMIFVDDEPWPPSLHGTGTEDYFAHAWGMQNVASLYHGVSLWVPPFPELQFPADYRGLWTMYRHHVLDPIPFTKSIRVSIEHGHANERCDDWSSTAYWYQSEPHVEQSALPPARDRVGYDG